MAKLSVDCEATYQTKTESIQELVELLKKVDIMLSAALFPIKDQSLHITNYGYYYIKVTWKEEREV